MALTKLTSLKVEKPRKPGMYGDGGGLYLRVSPMGAKSWIYRYMLDQKPHWMGLGPYPLFSLVEARAKAVDARKLRYEGVDPIGRRRALRASQRREDAKGITFRECTEAYIKAHRASWKHPKHVQQWGASLERYAHPVIGDLPIGIIDTAPVMKILEPNWQAKTETMARVRGRIEAVIDWAKIRGYRQGGNPALWRGHLDKMLPGRGKVVKPAHFEALAYTDMARFMADLRQRIGVAAAALEFIILTAVRVSDVMGSAREDRAPMLWSHVIKDVWTIPQTKNNKEHRVPLSRQALSVLQKVRGFEQDRVFPGVNNDSILHLLRKQMKAPTTIHGFRSSFRDWAGDCTAFDRETIEFALARGITDAAEAAYRRDTAMEKRRKLMSAWADYCDMLPGNSENIVPNRFSISGK